MDASAHFRGKKITVMGLGLLGRGMGDTRYLAECGAELIVTDLKSAEQLASSLEELKKFSNIAYTLGEHKLEDFRGRDMILKAAGVPLDSPYIAEAKKNNIPVRMSADLFVEISGVTCIGVTGTRGKSTVAHMIFDILQKNYELGLNGKTVGQTGKPVLGGNVRGISTLALIKDVTPGSAAVLELDSWQCQGLGEAGLSPHIAVFTTFYPDHSNYYGSTSLTTGKNDGMGLYLADKANIFLHQDPDDTLVIGRQCAPMLIDAYGELMSSKIVVADESKLPADWMLRIPGVHNRYNAALALAAVRAYGVEDSISRAALEQFAGVPGRLELVREVDDVKIYNDTTATTPEATLAALAALRQSSQSSRNATADAAGQSQNLILILGGADKGLDMSKLLAEVPTATKQVLLLAGTGTERIKTKLPSSMIYHTISDAVTAAMEIAEPGDIILFSPAFASFGMFKNEYDRGDQFNAIVKAL